MECEILVLSLYNHGFYVLAYKHGADNVMYYYTYICGMYDYTYMVFLYGGVRRMHEIHKM